VVSPVFDTTQRHVSGERGRLLLVGCAPRRPLKEMGYRCLSTTTSSPRRRLLKLTSSFSHQNASDRFPQLILSTAKRHGLPSEYFVFWFIPDAREERS